MRHLIPAVLAGLTLCAPAAYADYKQDALCVTGAAELCAELPSDMPDLDVPLGYTPTTNIDEGDGVQQQNFDYFGWQSFIALNWPVDASGAPLGSILDDMNAPRVWESYLGIEEVFPQADLVADDAEAACTPKGRMVLAQTSKLTSSSFIEPFTPSPLIDVDGNFVMYDIRINPTEVTYLRENGLTTAAGQKAFGTAWDLPRGVTGTPGAMELKTAWRVLRDDSNPMGYFTLPATLMIGAENSANGKPLCLEVTVGLVGMHIMHKITNPSAFSDNWVWATFEHLRNAPDATGAAPSQKNAAAKVSGNEPYPPVASCPVPQSAGSDWAFFDAKCEDVDGLCSPNIGLELRNYLWEPDMPFAEKYLTQSGSGTQVTRCWEVYESARNVDKVFQDALAGSVWANYQLIGVQWANGGLDHPDPLRPFPAPIYMVNSTLETFLQDVPVVHPDGTLNRGGSSSCINCHDIAKDKAGNRSDFSFLGGYAE